MLPPLPARKSYDDVPRDSLAYALFLNPLMEVDPLDNNNDEPPTLKTLTARLKHLPGKHDQSSHGKPGRVGSAFRGAYSAARAGGASHVEARNQAKTAAEQVRETIRAEKRAERIANPKPKRVAPPRATPTTPGKTYHESILEKQNEQIKQINVGLRQDQDAIYTVIDRRLRSPNLTEAQALEFITGDLTQVGIGYNNQRPAVSAGLMRDLQPAIEAAKEERRVAKIWSDMGKKLDEAIDSDADPAIIRKMQDEKNLYKDTTVDDAMYRTRSLINDALIKREAERPGSKRQTTPQVDFAGNTIVEGRTTIERRAGEVTVVSPTTPPRATTPTTPTTPTPTSGRALSDVQVTSSRPTINKERYGPNKGQENMRTVDVSVSGNYDGRAQPFTAYRFVSLDKGKTWNATNYTTGTTSSFTGSLKQAVQAVQRRFAENPPTVEQAEQARNVYSTTKADDSANGTPRKYGARAGEVIAGNLGRDTGGKFTRVGEDATSIIRAAINRGFASAAGGGKRGAKRAAVSDAQKKRQQADTGAGVMDALGFDASDWDYLASDKPQDASDPQFTRLIEQGLMDNVDGMAYPSALGRKVAAAAGAGNEDKAKELLARDTAKRSARQAKIDAQISAYDEVINDETASPRARAIAARRRTMLIGQSGTSTKADDVSMLELLTARLKHLPGKHDQSAHGKPGRVGSAFRGAYSAARAGGASHVEARNQAKSAAEQVRETIRSEKRAERIANPKPKRTRQSTLDNLRKQATDIENERNAIRSEMNKTKLFGDEFQRLTPQEQQARRQKVNELMQRGEELREQEINVSDKIRNQQQTAGQPARLTVQEEAEIGQQFRNQQADRRIAEERQKIANDIAKLSASGATPEQIRLREIQGEVAITGLQGLRLSSESPDFRQQTQRITDKQEELTLAGQRVIAQTRLAKLTEPSQIDRDNVRLVETAHEIKKLYNNTDASLSSAARMKELEGNPQYQALINERQQLFGKYSAGESRLPKQSERQREDNDDFSSTMSIREEMDKTNRVPARAKLRDETPTDTRPVIDVATAQKHNGRIMNLKNNLALAEKDKAFALAELPKVEAKYAGDTSDLAVFNLKRAQSNVASAQERIDRANQGIAKFSREKPEGRAYTTADNPEIRAYAERMGIPDHEGFVFTDQWKGEIQLLAKQGFRKPAK